MTPEATRNLLLRRRELTGETFNDNTVRSWGDLLANIDYPDAVQALNRAATEHERINARHLHEHLPTTQRPDPRPLGSDECLECDGTGFSAIRDATATLSYGPCTHCRPSESHKRRQPSDTPAAIPFAAVDPARVAARRAWFTAGMHGHYPDCPCDRCASRITVEETA